MVHPIVLQANLENQAVLVAVVLLRRQAILRLVELQLNLNNQAILELTVLVAMVELETNLTHQDRYRLVAVAVALIPLVVMHQIHRAAQVVLVVLVNNTVFLVHKSIMLVAAVVETKTLVRLQLVVQVDKVVAAMAAAAQAETMQEREQQTVAAVAVAVVRHLHKQYQAQSQTIHLIRPHLTLVAQEVVLVSLS